MVRTGDEGVGAHLVFDDQTCLLQYSSRFPMREDNYLASLIATHYPLSDIEHYYHTIFTIFSLPFILTIF